MSITQERATSSGDRFRRAAELPAPAAVRLRRPGWKDPRLLLGVALVGVSVATGAWAVGTAGRTTPVLVARDVLVPGEVVTADDVEVREVRLGGTAGAYLVPGDLADGVRATRTVGAGELVPRLAVAAEAGADLRTVAVTPRGAVSRDVVPGAVVELWFVPAPEEGVDPEPRLLVGSVTVVEVSEPTGAFATGGALSVQVLVPVDALPDVLGAMAGGGSVEVVPLAGTPGTP